MPLDPRTLWTSPDGVEAIAFNTDIPKGVPVGYYYSLMIYNTLTAAINAAIPDKVGSFPNSNTHNKCICKVLRIHLPWEPGHIPYKKPTPKWTLDNVEVSGVITFDADDSHYPHKCHYCGGAAYIGQSVDCQKKCKGSLGR